MLRREAILRLNSIGFEQEPKESVNVLQYAIEHGELPLIKTNEKGEYVFVHPNGETSLPCGDAVKYIKTEIDIAKQAIAESLTDRLANGESLSTELLNQLKQLREEIKPTVTIKHTKKTEKQRGILDEKQYLEPLYMLKLISENRVAELANTDITQSQSPITRPLWGWLKKAVETISPMNAYSQQYKDAREKVALNELRKLSGKSPLKIGAREKAYATYTADQYDERTIKSQLLSDGTFESVESDRFWIPALKLGFYITKKQMDDASLVFGTNRRILEGFVYDLVKGHHTNWFGDAWNTATGIIPLPLPKAGGGGHH
jgi:hypothetical protein